MHEAHTWQDTKKYNEKTHTSGVEARSGRVWTWASVSWGEEVEIEEKTVEHAIEASYTSLCVIGWVLFSGFWVGRESDLWVCGWAVNAYWIVWAHYLRVYSPIWFPFDYPSRFPLRFQANCHPPHIYRIDQLIFVFVLFRKICWLFLWRHCRLTPIDSDVGAKLYPYTPQSNTHTLTPKPILTFTPLQKQTHTLSLPSFDFR